MKESLSGKVVAITGGGRGIGRATASALIGEGARVAIGDLDATLARTTADELGPGAVGLPLDVTDRDSFAAFLDGAEAALGPLDALVNNAGLMLIGPFASQGPEDAERMIDVNLRGVVAGSQLALQRFQARDRGHIVNIASMAGKAGFPAGAAYCATKWGVVGLTESLRSETHGTAIRVSVVMPAIVRTELSTGLVEGRVLKGVVDPEDVAAAIVRALRSGAFDVFVPRYTGWIYNVMMALPRRVREFIGRGLGVDRVLEDADPAVRRSYQALAGRADSAVTDQREDDPVAVLDPVPPA